MTGILGGFLWLTGCETTAAGGKHKTMAQAADHPMMCQKCYDEAVRVRKPGTKWRRTQVIKKHMCPDCKAEMTTYTKDGKAMIKCASCAPEGVACDKCMPPKKSS